MSQPAVLGILQAINASGPVVGATIEYYVTGTTTPTAVYSDNTLNTSLGSVLNGGNASNSLGYFPVHWLDPQVSYKRIVKDSLGSQITSLCVDPVQVADTGTTNAQSIATIATIAALQAKTWGSATVPNVLLVISNSSPGDGGGIFRYDSSDTTTADNGTTVILDGDGHRWKRQTQEELYNLAVTNGWYLPTSNTPSLRANSTIVATATSTKGLMKDETIGGVDATEVGFAGTIIVAMSGSMTLAASHRGKTLYHTSATPHTLTIDSNANLALPVGFMFSLENEHGAGAVTVAITTDTMRWTTTTGSRTLAADGTMYFKKMTSTLWRTTGTNIS